MSEPKSSRSAARSKGLARLRHLQEDDRPSSQQNANLPSGWFYNEQNENDFWNEMEAGKDEAHYAALETSNKKAQNIANIGDSSKKINEILSTFDRIDGEVLMEMLEITSDIDQNGDIDADAILDATRNQVIQFCGDMLDISKNQETLIESLKTWFQSLEKTDVFLNRELSVSSDSPNTKEVFERFQQIIEEASEIRKSCNNPHRCY